MLIKKIKLAMLAILFILPAVVKAGPIIDNLRYSGAEVKTGGMFQETTLLISFPNTVEGNVAFITFAQTIQQKAAESMLAEYVQYSQAGDTVVRIVGSAKTIFPDDYDNDKNQWKIEEMRRSAAETRPLPPSAPQTPTVALTDGNAPAVTTPVVQTSNPTREKTALEKEMDN